MGVGALFVEWLARFAGGQCDDDGFDGLASPVSTAFPMSGLDQGIHWPDSHASDELTKASPSPAVILSFAPVRETSVGCRE